MSFLHIPSTQQRAEWRRLAEVATPGPWSRVKNLASKWWTLGKITNHQAIPLEREEDWNFAEAAREAVPALLDAVDALEAALKKAQKAR